MHRYTPSKERVRAEWLRRRRAERRGRAAGPVIPDNSEPWLDRPPASLGDLIRISDEILKLEASWKNRVERS
ncbi:MAG: hypothetical protein JXR37_19750 [Kiritimatiellae bacterium]|nr:hypothetical protein [Kiritimatiellia bacterium]